MKKSKGLKFHSVVMAMIVSFAFIGAVEASDITVTNNSSYTISGYVTPSPGTVNQFSNIAPKGGQKSFHFTLAFVSHVVVSNQLSPNHGLMSCTLTYSGSQIAPSSSGDYTSHSVFVWTGNALPADITASLSVVCVDKAN
jgi:hypothetical protein